MASSVSGHSDNSGGLMTRSYLLSAAFGMLLVLDLPARVAAGSGPVNFSRDIRPLLSDNCFQCHGPDASQRQADLRLDQQSGLFRTSDSMAMVAPGNPADSELWRRLTTDNPDERMPPADSGRNLTDAQRDLIRRWIEQGADWKQHWAFVGPSRPALPDVSLPDRIRNPIDAFILARLDSERRSPADEADRRTLIRRVTLDLTGVPPTPEEIQEFVVDDSPQAYERVVDRLLASPRFAERMAVRWLDAARYADTSGYQSDGPRDMWRWRDWVINAFHQNKPFDVFTIEQLAGDLLPDPTLDQLIATGFNRNHRGNAEGGVVAEEFQVEYVVDRVDTTFTVWQGLTMGCGRCHSHKYDPILQHEYYQVFAYFNNIPENGRAIKEGNSPPFIAAPTPDQQIRLTELEQQLAAARARLAAVDDRLPAALAAWNSADAAQYTDWTDTESLVVRLTFDGDLANTATQPEGETRRSATTVPEAGAKEESSPDHDPRLVTLSVDSPATPDYTPGRLNSAMPFDGTRWIDAGNKGRLGYFERFTFAAWIRQDQHAHGTILSRMEDIPRGGGYSFDVTDTGHLQLNLVKRWLDDCIRVESLAAIPTGRWVHVCAAYDGSRTAEGIQFYMDGHPVDLKANFDFINQTFAVNEPLRIGHGQANFRGLIDDVRIYRRHLTADDVQVIAEATPVPVLLAAAVSAGSESGAESIAVPSKLRRCWLTAAGPANARTAWSEVIRLEGELDTFRRSLPTVMVMQEMDQKRPTHVLLRGQYDRPGDPVERGVPSSLPPLPPDAPDNRLGLARWLVSPDNPLTARVTVNRFWRDLFGIGLVKTTEDFGVQGEPPSHPELLDWLAVEFMDSGWNVKHIMKTIVMSGTYRQDSTTTPESLAADPDNRLVARGPRFRLPAETVRDQALFVSGLLTERLGGPSVKPYQPAGLWEEIATDTLYDQSHGPDLYRRSLYTYWKRTVPSPMMTNFDAAGRETCEVRLTRTNTPLQALNLLNDVTFIEAARVLAQRSLTDWHPQHSDADRVSSLFTRILSRPATDQESELLLAALDRYRTRFHEHPDDAQSLITQGESPLPDGWTTPDRQTTLAAWTMISSTILNLDEAVTRE